MNMDPSDYVRSRRATLLELIQAVRQESEAALTTAHAAMANAPRQEKLSLPWRFPESDWDSRVQRTEHPARRP